MLICQTTYNFNCYKCLRGHILQKFYSLELSKSHLRQLRIVYITKNKNPSEYQPSFGYVQMIFRHAMFKKRLLLSFKKKHQSQRIREKYLTERYDQLLQQWVKKVESIESKAKRRCVNISFFYLSFFLFI